MTDEPAVGMLSVSFSEQTIMTSLELKTRILAGGRVVITKTGLPEGATVTVQITVEDEPPGRTIAEHLKDNPGGQLFRTVEKVDQNIREERDAWGD